jgi:GTPase SAR1 family protein
MKSVFIGDSGTGKSFIIAQLMGVCPEIGQTLELQPNVLIVDTPGSEGFDRFRPPLYYSSTHIFILYNSHASLHNVKEKWLDEARFYAPGSLRILVCTSVSNELKRLGLLLASNLKIEFCDWSLGLAKSDLMRFYNASQKDDTYFGLYGAFT